MARVIHFELPADNPERAMKFYKEAFGWENEKWDGPMEYWLVTTGKDEEPGINGAILKKEPCMDHIVCTIDVDDIDETLKKVESAGGIILSPKTHVPGVGWMFYFKDTEGNTFGAMKWSPEESKQDT